MAASITRVSADPVCLRDPQVLERKLERESNRDHRHHRGRMPVERSAE
jgi:hypothetical protein